MQQRQSAFFKKVKSQVRPRPPTSMMALAQGGRKQSNIRGLLQLSGLPGEGESMTTGKHFLLPFLQQPPSLSNLHLKGFLS